MIQYSIVIFIYSYPCCFHLLSAFIFNCLSLSLFFSSSSHLLSSTFHLPPHLPAHSLSSSLPSSFLSFSSSFPPVPTLFLLSPFFIVPIFYPLFQPFPSIKIFLPHPNHLTWQASMKLDVTRISNKPVAGPQTLVALSYKKKKKNK